MDNPGLPSHLWLTLDGGLWHATGPDGLRGILDAGGIRIIPGRYDGSFAKRHNAVSLFDFGPTARDDWGQFDNWSGWFGFQQDCRVAIWLKIDRAATSPAVFDAGETHRLWSEDHGGTVIPGVEACHQGSIALPAIVGMVMIDRHDRSTFRYVADPLRFLDELSKFESDLPPEPPEDPITAGLRRAIARKSGGGASRPLD